MCGRHQSDQEKIGPNCLQLYCRQSQSNRKEPQPFCSEQLYCADPENFVRGSPTLTTFFFFFFFFFLRGVREDRKATKNGPSSARLRNAIEIAFCWRVDNGPPLNAGLVAL